MITYILFMAGIMKYASAYKGKNAIVELIENTSEAVECSEYKDILLGNGYDGTFSVEQHKNTDIGKTIVDGGFGWWCESDNEYGFSELVETIISQGTNLPEIGKQGFRYLNEQFTSERTYRKIFEIMKNE